MGYEIQVRVFMVVADDSFLSSPIKWEMSGDLFFEDEDDIREFKEEIKVLFQKYLTDDCEVYTLEESEEKFK